MKTFYDTLKIDYASCPPDCSACAEACSRDRNDNLVGGRGIAVIHAPEVNFHMAMVCNQCGEPACREICPTKAIVKDSSSGIVRVTQEKCVGCGLCALACPYGGIAFDPNKRRPWRCDLCGGEPECVDACKYGVLSFLKSRSVVEYFHDEDVLTPGAAYCSGCGAELLMRFTIKVLGKDTFVLTTPGCGLLAVTGRGLQATCHLPSHVCLMTNTPSTATGIKKYYHKMGKDVRCLVFIGDGCAADVGFQPLSGAAERGDNLIVVCNDNEAYMNTGIQRSSTTPFLGWTFTSPSGKKRQGKAEYPKYMPLIMAFHGIPYAATACLSYPEDYARKLTKAMAVKDGLSYIHVLSPCNQGWRATANSAIEIGRMAVETNYFPLWEAERGEFRFTYKVANPLPIQRFTELMGRFSHLDAEGMAKFQEFVNGRFSLIERLTRL